MCNTYRKTAVVIYGFNGVPITGMYLAGGGAGHGFATSIMVFTAGDDDAV